MCPLSSVLSLELLQMSLGLKAVSLLRKQESQEVEVTCVCWSEEEET